MLLPLPIELPEGTTLSPIEFPKPDIEGVMLLPLPIELPKPDTEGLQNRKEALEDTIKSDCCFMMLWRCPAQCSTQNTGPDLRISLASSA